MPDMDELIEIAIAAADNINDMDVSLDALIAAAVRAVVPVVREDERAACAKEADYYVPNSYSAKHIAAAIRARP